MRILFLSTTAQPETWLGPLGAALPDDEIMVYPELGDPATIECAIVAVPPPGVLTGLPKLRLIQSLWVVWSHCYATPHSQRTCRWPAWSIRA